MLRPLLIIAAALATTAASAETIRLSPAEAEAAIEAGAARQSRAAQALPDNPPLDRGVHGEVGVAIGTQGYRSMYGVIGVPLGDSGGVLLGYNNERGRDLFYGRRNLCRGASAQLCDAEYGLQLLDPAR